MGMVYSCVSSYCVMFRHHSKIDWWGSGTERSAARLDWRLGNDMREKKPAWFVQWIRGFFFLHFTQLGKLWFLHLIAWRKYVLVTFCESLELVLISSSSSAGLVLDSLPGVFEGGGDSSIVSTLRRFVFPSPQWIPDKFCTSSKG